MPQIIETVDVTVPVRQAYDQWTRFEEFPEFLDEVEKIVQVDDKTTDWTVKVAGQERDFRAVITEQHPDERVAWTVKDGEVAVFARDEGVRADLAREIGAHPDAAVYACGPARMLEQVAGLVPEASGRLHLEYFTAPVVEYAPGGPFAVRLALTGVELTVEPDQSVLEVMRSAGVDVLSDCEEGICGSCETGVLEGEVEHRDHVLTLQEKAANDCLMVCVSRAACPVLVLQA